MALMPRAKASPTGPLEQRTCCTDLDGHQGNEGHQEAACCGWLLTANSSRSRPSEFTLGTTGPKGEQP